MIMAATYTYTQMPVTTTILPPSSYRTTRTHDQTQTRARTRTFQPPVPAAAITRTGASFEVSSAPWSSYHGHSRDFNNNNTMVWSDSSSPAASSNISTEQNSIDRVHSHSPYEVLNSPSNSNSASPPSLQPTLSRNGSDTSDNNAWVSILPVYPAAGEPGSNSMAVGSAGASHGASTYISPQRSLDLRRNAVSLQTGRNANHKNIHSQRFPLLPPHSDAPISSCRSGNDSGAHVYMVEDVPTLHSRFPHVQHSYRSIDLYSEPHSNSHTSQAVSLWPQQALPLRSEDPWYDVGLQTDINITGPRAELSWGGGGGGGLTTPDQQSAAGASSRTELELETIPVSTSSASYRQATATIDTALRMVDIDDPHSIISWKEYVLNPHYDHQLNNQKALLGIPPAAAITPEFSPSRTQSFILREPAECVQMATGVSNSCIESLLGHNINALSATLAAGSTSSGSHSPSRPRVLDELSILPARAAGPRGLKRPIDDDLWEGPKSTKIAEYAGFLESDNWSTHSNRSYNSKPDLPLQQFTKRTKRRGVSTSAINDSSLDPDVQRNLQAHLSIDSWPSIQPQPASQGPAGRHIIDSMDGFRYRDFTHEQPEAEEFRPLTGSAEDPAIYGVDRTTHHFEPEIPLQLYVDQHAFDSGEIHEPQRYHPDGHQASIGGPCDESSWGSSLTVVPGFSNTLGREGLSAISDTHVNMRSSAGGDGSDNQSFLVGREIIYVSELSSNPSPSPVNTPADSPGPRPGIPVGPTRPPPTQLAVQQPQNNSFSGYTPPGEYVNTRANSPLGNTLWTPDQQEALVTVAGNWTQCIYVPQPPEYEAEDEQADVEDRIVSDGISTTTHHGRPQKKKRQAFTDDRRVAVHGVRKLGACMRCKFLRECCDEETPCGNCRKVDGKQKIWGSMPCLRLKITDAMLFRNGNSKFGQERAIHLPTPTWNSKMGKRQLFLGRAPPIATKYWGPQRKYPELRIQCQVFIPRENDLLFETWNEDGREIQFPLPAFAACDLEDVSLAVRNYVRETFDLFKQDMVNEENPLVSLVFREAIRYTEAHQCAKENKKGTQQEACMLKDALKIWILTRLAYEGFGILRGHEEFGVDVITNPKSPYYGTVPIPPILDHQLDTVGIHEMIRLKENVLKALKTRIQKRRESQWYEVFLTIFVLLHNLEYIARKQYLYTKRHESTRASMGERNIEFFRTTWMAEWETAANMLIKHFQVALKGAVPFTFNWEGSEDGKESTGSDGAKGKRKGKGKRKADPVVQAQQQAGMDDRGVAFMKDVCKILRDNKHDFQRLRRESERREYDRHMVWVSQLFMDVE